MGSKWSNQTGSKWLFQLGSNTGTENSRYALQLCQIYFFQVKIFTIFLF